MFGARAYSVPKADGHRNEDSFKLGTNVIALSDGASVSYDSVRWSRGLAAQYSRRPTFSQEWLATAICRFSRHYDRDAMPWMKQAAYDRGTFASLLGAQFLSNGEGVNIFAVGDSIAVLCDGDSINQSFPYTDASQFDARPQLLCTNAEENAFLEEVAPTSLNQFWTFEGLENPALLCVTDALGQWVLAGGSAAVHALRQIDNREAFAELVHEQRATGAMRRDDTTMIAVWEAKNALSANR